MTLRRLGELHVFLRRDTARTRVSALSGIRLPDCFTRIQACDLRDAERQSKRVRADETGCTVFVDVEVLIDSDARAALQAAEQLGPSRGAVRYVGTPHGLAGFIADLHTVGIADGVTLIPLRPADSAQRIIDDVLPMLGVDTGRLAA